MFGCQRTEPRTRPRVPHANGKAQLGRSASRKRFFDEGTAVRRAAGEESYHLPLCERDPNRIVHFSRWRTIEEAMAFLESPAVMETRRMVGVAVLEVIYLPAAG